MGIEIIIAGIFLVAAAVVAAAIVAAAAHEREREARRRHQEAIGRTAWQTRQRIDQLCEHYLRQEYDDAMRRLSR